MKRVYMETGVRKLMGSGNRNDGWACMEMGMEKGTSMKAMEMHEGWLWVV